MVEESKRELAQHKKLLSERKRPKIERKKMVRSVNLYEHVFISPNHSES